MILRGQGKIANDAIVHSFATMRYKNTDHFWLMNFLVLLRDQASPFGTLLQMYSKETHNIDIVVPAEPCAETPAAAAVQGN